MQYLLLYGEPLLSRDGKIVVYRASRLVIRFPDDESVIRWAKEIVPSAQGVSLNGVLHLARPMGLMRSEENRQELIWEMSAKKVALVQR